MCFEEYVVHYIVDDIVEDGMGLISGVSHQSACRRPASIARALFTNFDMLSRFSVSPATMIPVCGKLSLVDISRSPRKA
jgi:hypothetical protein